MSRAEPAIGLVGHCLGDANFNVPTLVDTAGDAIERYTYDPCGVLAIHDNAWSNIRGAPNYGVEYTCTGRTLDAETGLMYYLHRVYVPLISREAARG